MTVEKKAGKSRRLSRSRARKVPRRSPSGTSATSTPGAPTSTSSARPSPRRATPTINETGGWRALVPEIDSEKCDGCMLCYFYCPDASIIIEDGKAVGIDLKHCKGCGICAKECPTDAIVMKTDEKE